MTTRTPNRRGFHQTIAATGAAFAMPTIIPSSALGLGGIVAPSERIRLGGIGVRNRGGKVLGAMLEQPDVEFVAIADVRADSREKVKKMADAKNGNDRCDTYIDMHELLDRDDIDAVLIATGDRWHAPAAINAIQAGKDVYCEKPCGITIELCQKLRTPSSVTGEFSSRHAATQPRPLRHACRLAQNGGLGKLRTVHASIYELIDRHDWLPEQPEPPQEVCDWDRWLGPAPWRPFNQAYVDGRWRGYHDFDSGARLLDWGAHTLDLCQWASSATVRCLFHGSRWTSPATTSYTASTTTESRSSCGNQAGSDWAPVRFVWKAMRAGSKPATRDASKFQVTNFAASFRRHTTRVPFRGNMFATFLTVSKHAQRHWPMSP